MSTIGIGVQLYTLRSEGSKDFKGMLRKVAELGYEGVEFAGYGGLSPQELKEELEQLGLTAVGSHVGLPRLKENLQEEIEMNAAIGSKYVTCPGWFKEGRTQEEFLEVVQILQHSSRRFAEHGIAFGYHNHSFEFEEKMGEKTLFDAFFSALPPEELFVELDVCWAHNAGLDPVDVMKQYAGRTPLLHMKDLRKEDGKLLTVELGTGEVDLKPILAAAPETGVKWFIVEQDECQNPPFDSIATSREWLRSSYR
ncbi:sugar phosphate isomerase/epimerase family protein [Paenibacillus lutrae]|uniref:TIM barrel protein n=1 Tax=Paenibacillus lutrae TaxID=2078573 RepID=A0A7X3JZ77_9BACL|nr:sugar phosphate isomerase/epimerase [Paenibacillus lutrae]MVO99754.1 TIM barrel protein [Paenibacillus lutrae]